MNELVPVQKAAPSVHSLRSLQRETSPEMEGFAANIKY